MLGTGCEKAPPGNGCLIKSGIIATTIAMSMWKGENFMGSQTDKELQAINNYWETGS